MTEALFACTKCHSRHPFEELSQVEQLCKNCCNNDPVAKCQYCRVDFKPLKGNSSSECKNCAYNLKLHGEPSSCEYCSVLAAFSGRQCQRCIYSEQKYGPPIMCEQCKQKCAFNKSEESKKKVDGKMLCWLCTLTYKRVLYKTRRRDHANSMQRLSSSTANKSVISTEQMTNDLANDTSESKSHDERRHSQHHHNRHHHKHKRPHRHHHHRHRHNDKTETADIGESAKKSKVDVGSATNSPSVTNKPLTQITTKSTNAVSTPSNTSTNDQSFMDISVSDHMIAITQLHDQLESMKKLIDSKDRVIMEKERKITELKANQYEAEKEFRIKITRLQEESQDKQELLQTKNRELQAKIKTLSKSKKLGTSSPML